MNNTLAKFHPGRAFRSWREMLELRPCGDAIHDFWHRVADKFRLPPQRTSVLADLSVTNVTGSNLATIAECLLWLS